MRVGVDADMRVREEGMERGSFDWIRLVRMEGEDEDGGKVDVWF